MQGGRQPHSSISVHWVGYGSRPQGVQEWEGGDGQQFIRAAFSCSVGAWQAGKPMQFMHITAPGAANAGAHPVLLEVDPLVESAYTLPICLNVSPIR